MPISNREADSGSRPGWRPWVVYGPLLVLGGALLGHQFPEWTGRTPARSWRPPEPVKVLPAPAQDGSLAPVVARVRPGVVRIVTAQRQKKRATGPAAGDGVNRGADAGSRYVEATDTVEALGLVYGTGFLVHEDGLVVTSRHVVASPAAIRVEIEGHTKTFVAELLGEDETSDLAVLRISDAPGGLTALRLGDSSAVRQGDRAFCIGNPFEFQRTLSVGWITYVDRHVPEERVRVTSPYLQFSAPINPGDSGAPVCDWQGNVVGMTRRTLREGRGLSFAVPSRVIKALLKAIERGDARIRRGYVGMEFQRPSRPELLRGLVEEGGGAEVTQVFDGHPADSAGIQVGDVILSFDGQAVDNAADLYDWIIESRPGTQANMSVVRSGEVLAPMTVVVGEVGKSTSID